MLSSYDTKYYLDDKIRILQYYCTFLVNRSVCQGKLPRASTHLLLVPFLSAPTLLSLSLKIADIEGLAELGAAKIAVSKGPLVMSSLRYHPTSRLRWLADRLPQPSTYSADARMKFVAKL